jgi:competence protein ComEC
MAAGGLMMLWSPPPPDLLIDASGRNVALRDEAGQLVPASRGRARFAVEKWLEANGEEAGMAAAAKRPGWRCAEDQCRAEVKGRRVVFVSREDAGRPGCANVDILIASFPLRGACAGVPVRIDRFDLWRGGAAALWIMPEGVRLETARGWQGVRPWVVRPEARARVFTTD